MTGLKDHEEEIHRALSRVERVTRFAEILAERSRGESLSLDRRATSLGSSPRLQGAIVRAWDGARWVEAATSGLGDETLGEAVETLRARLEKAPRAGADAPGESATTRREWTEVPARPMRDLGADAALGLAKDVFAWATAVPGIRDAQVHMAWSESERVYANTAGARCFVRLNHVRATVVPLALDGGRVEYDYLGQGGIGGQERLGFLTEEAVTTSARNAEEMLRAKSPPTGELTVLLDPSTTGTFAHESFGHGTEADQFVRNRSYLRPLLGTTLGPEFLTIADDGSYPGGWGTILCDDEGHPAQRTHLVDHGRFVGALHDRATAAEYGTRATGNTRRADFLSRAYIRMTNTFVEPGDWSLDELVREAGNGVLLERATSGIEDPQGGQMQLKVKMGRRIEGGRLTHRVQSMALSGRVLDFLGAIRGVSRKSDFEISPGFCGKGHTDLLTSGTGGTYLLSTAIVGPA